MGEDLLCYQITALDSRSSNAKRLINLTECGDCFWKASMYCNWFSNQNSNQN